MLKKEQLKPIHEGLKQKFDIIKPIYRDVRDFIYPYIGRFDDDNPVTEKRHDNYLLRSTTIKYANVLAAGLQSGITSPTKKWLKLKTNDDALMQNGNVRVWLSQVEDKTLSIMSMGHFYQNNLLANLELGCFGTSAMFMADDPILGVRFHTFTAGEYYIDVNDKDEIDTFARQFKVSARQLYNMFKGNVPDTVKRAMYSPNTTNYYTVYQLILPNEDYDPSMWDNLHFRFSEYLWCDEFKELMSVSGYHEFPVSVSRWQTKPNSPYGIGAGIWSVRPARELQLVQKDIAQMTEIMANPPLQAPADILANGGVNLLPSAVNYYNPVGNSSGMITPILDSRTFNMDSVIVHRTTLEEEIKDHFHYNVFQLLSDMDKGTRTAREIVELSSEKMSQMGALVDRMETEILPNIVKRVLSIGLRRGLYPPAPEELKGQELSISFESVLSQAQRQSDITPIVDTLETAINIANTAQIPEVLDSIDFDEALRSIADYNGINPKILKSRETVARIRQQRAQQQEQLMQMQAQMAQAETAKTLSQAKTDDSSALTQLLGGATPNGLVSY